MLVMPNTLFQGIVGKGPPDGTWDALWGPGLPAARLPVLTSPSSPPSPHLPVPHLPVPHLPVPHLPVLTSRSLISQSFISQSSPRSSPISQSFISQSSPRSSPSPGPPSPSPPLPPLPISPPNPPLPVPPLPVPYLPVPPPGPTLGSAPPAPPPWREDAVPAHQHTDPHGGWPHHGGRRAFGSRPDELPGGHEEEHAGESLLGVLRERRTADSLEQAGELWLPGGEHDRRGPDTGVVPPQGIVRKTPQGIARKTSALLPETTSHGTDSNLFPLNSFLSQTPGTRARGGEE